MNDSLINTSKDLIAIINTNGSEHTERFTVSSTDSLTVGRAWTNDLIVNDKYIDPHHLELSIDDSARLTIKDLDTKNGSRINKKSLQEALDYRQGDLLFVGETEIRFYDSQEQVAAALPLDSTHLVARRFGSLGFVALATLGAIIAQFAYLYFFETNEFNASTVFSSLVRAISIGIVWCLLAGFIGKLFRQETNLALHWILLCCFTVAIVVLQFPIGIIKFNLDSTFFNDAVQYLFIALVLGFFSYATLSLVSRLSTKQKKIIAVLIALIPQLISSLTPLLKEERDLWSSEADSRRETQTPVFMWRSVDSVESHLDKMDDLFERIETQAEKD